jgi:RHS repeat-associated protein
MWSRCPAFAVKHVIPAYGTHNYTHYIGNVVYEGNTLSYILTEEGRLVPFGTGSERVFKYEYNLKDHLGNSRVTFMGTDLGGPVDIVQKTSYYPFGLVLTQINQESTSGYNKNLYLYNGKEIQDQSLGGVNLDWYDFHTRFYDPQIGRWMTPDPLSEVNRKWSPYRFAYDNPLRFIDPDGMLEDDYKLKQDGSIEFVKSTNSTTDELYATKGDGTINKDNSISVKKGTFSNEVKIDPLAVTGGGCSREKIVGKGEGYQIDNTDDASKVFKFASDNTSIEFGLVETNGSGSVLLTNHTKDAVAATKTAVNMSNEGKQISEVTHSHPINVGPSDADKTNAGNFSTSQGKAVSFNIYQPKSKMVVGYDKNGVIFQMSSTLFYGK